MMDEEETILVMVGDKIQRRAKYCDFFWTEAMNEAKLQLDAPVTVTRISYSQNGRVGSVWLDGIKSSWGIEFFDLAEMKISVRSLKEFL